MLTASESANDKKECAGGNTLFSLLGGRLVQRFRSHGASPVCRSNGAGARDPTGANRANGDLASQALPNLNPTGRPSRAAAQVEAGRADRAERRREAQRMDHRNLERLLGRA